MNKVIIDLQMICKKLLRTKLNVGIMLQKDKIFNKCYKFEIDLLNDISFENISQKKINRKISWNK